MSDCLFCRRGIAQVDYKHVALLRSELRDDGTLRARRTTRFCRKHHARLAIAVKRARFMALLPAERPPREIEWPPVGKKRKRKAGVSRERSGGA